MWGQGANAKSYPAGYGYVPSSVVTASYTSAVAPGPVGKVTVAPATSEIAGNAGQAGPTADSPVSAQLQIGYDYSFSGGGGYRQHYAIEGGRNLQRWFSQRRHC